jgi:hypothetical protein
MRGCADGAVGTGRMAVEEIWLRFVDNLVDRVSGPLKFRLVLQPLMAAYFAIRSGLTDAKAGKPPYFWAMFTHPEHRAEMVHDGWKSVGKIFVLAVVLDVIYQIIVLRFVYPGEVLVVALVLAIVPYLILRGLVNRMVRKPPEAFRPRA